MSAGPLTAGSHEPTKLDYKTISMGGHSGYYPSQHDPMDLQDFITIPSFGVPQWILKYVTVITCEAFGVCITSALTNMKRNARWVKAFINQA